MLPFHSRKLVIATLGMCVGVMSPDTLLVVDKQSLKHLDHHYILFCKIFDNIIKINELNPCVAYETWLPW